MKTRVRTIHPLFQQSTIVFGVRLTDWKFVGAGAVLVFLACLIFNLKLKGLHLSFPAAIFFILSGALFFNWVRIKRRPLWLEHQISRIFRQIRRKNEDLEIIASNYHHPQNWLIESTDKDYKK